MTSAVKRQLRFEAERIGGHQNGYALLPDRSSARTGEIPDSRHCPIFSGWRDDRQVPFCHENPACLEA
jgi:hypothetical protein